MYPNGRGRPPCSVCGGAQTWDVSCRCCEVVEAFRALMLAELRANSHKGGRSDWSSAAPEAMLAEVHHHVAKLHVAVSELQRRRAGQAPRPTPWGDDVEARVSEFGPDTANMVLMLLDCLALVELPGPAAAPALRSV